MYKALLIFFIYFLWVVKALAIEHTWLVVSSAPVPPNLFEGVGAVVVSSSHPVRHKWWYKVSFKGEQMPFQQQWSTLKQLPQVEWVEPEQKVEPESLPSDVGANRFWWEAVRADLLDVQQRDCSNTIVVVLDSGIDIQHPDLESVVWTNPLEEVNEADDDGNGYIDDVHGWDVLKQSGVQTDAFGHGTHVAGIIGALNNNGGVAGLCNGVQILPLRFLNSFGSGYVSDAVEALQYLLDLIDQGYLVGKRIILNNSWVINNYSLALEIMLDALHEKGVLVVNAAGNLGWNIDQKPVWPANFAYNKLWQMGIGNADVEAGKPAGSSNYGVQAVTVAAPGVNILSTWPGADYQSETGTSMAVPVVSALAAMLWTSHPEWSAEEVRAVIEGGVVPEKPFVGHVKARGWVRFEDSLQASSPWPLLGYIENYTLMGIHLDQISQLTLLNKPLPYHYDEKTQGLQLVQPESLRCGYIYPDVERVKPFYLNVLPAPPENITVQYEPGRWILSWNSHENVDQVKLQGLNDQGLFEDIKVLANQTQSAEIEPLNGYHQLRLVAQMQCEGEDGQPIIRSSSPSDPVNLDEVPLWHTVAAGPAVSAENYTIALSVERGSTLQLGGMHTCNGLALRETFISGRIEQSGECMIDVIANSPAGKSARLQLPIAVLQNKQPSFVLKWENIQVGVDLSGVDGVLGSTLEKWGGEWVVKLVTSTAAEGVLQLVAPQHMHFETNGNYTLSTDRHRLQVALSQLQSEPGLDDMRIYHLSFQLQNDVAPVTKKDTRCFFASYLFGRSAWQTNLLRAFRDQVLLRIPGGQSFVTAYYEFAPRVLTHLQKLPVFSETFKFLLDRMFSPWLAALSYLSSLSRSL